MLRNCHRRRKKKGREDNTLMMINLWSVTVNGIEHLSTKYVIYFFYPSFSFSFFCCCWHFRILMVIDSWWNYVGNASIAELMLQYNKNWLSLVSCRLSVSVVLRSFAIGYAVNHSWAVHSLNNQTNLHHQTTEYSQDIIAHTALNELTSFVFFFFFFL